ncbi:MAG: M48 family metallopeptidase [Spirochaetia bacterium]|nr:M48 family metallopeptidase [Spirochaetia bacterium]
MKKSLSVLLFFAAIMLFTSCASILSTSKDGVFISEEYEVQLGLATEKEYMKDFPLYEDKAVQDYVTALGTKLAAQSDRTTLNYRFKVAKSDTINAFAIPGGIIYVTTGIMKNLTDEAQLAAVLGHEIGHVAKKHTVKQFQRGLLAKFGIEFISSMFTKDDSDAEKSTMMAQAASVGVGLLNLANSRENEYEADEQGSILASRIGLDPKATIDVQNLLLKLRKTKPGALEQMLSTHPISEERIAHAEQYIKEYSLTGTSRGSKTFASIKAKIK